MTEAIKDAQTKEAYYSGLVTGYETKLKGIDERLAGGQGAESYDRGALLIEQSQLTYDLFYKKNLIDKWKARAAHYEALFESQSKEANEKLAETEAAADALKHHQDVSFLLKGYKNPDNRQDLKNEYYMALKNVVTKYQSRKR